MSRSGQSLRVRFGFIALWVAVLLWLPLEDGGPFNARLLAALACVLIAARTLQRLPRTIQRPARVFQRPARVFQRPARIFQRFTRLSLPASAALGLAAGLLVNPLAAGLMVFKSGLHGHAAPDFSAATLAGVLADTPVYGIGGLLIGAGLYYFYRTT